MNVNFSADLKQFRDQARRSLDGEETFAADPWRGIAERVLGLPPDIRVDKGKPFNQVPAARQ